jgi:hypothetical protein
MRAPAICITAMTMAWAPALGFAGPAPRHAAKPTKPTKAEVAAIGLARDWLAALPASPAALARITAKPFFAVIYKDAGTPCPPAADATCLRDQLAPQGTPHIWRHTLGGPLAAQRARLADKTAIVVELDNGCDGTENQTLVVTKAGKVTAVMMQIVDCSE